MSRKSNGLFDTLFFIWGIISFKIKIDLKRSENPTSVTDEAILNPLQKNRGFLDSLRPSPGDGLIVTDIEDQDMNEIEFLLSPFFKNLDLDTVDSGPSYGVPDMI
ncbi:hypothetical protein [Paenibacillus sp. FSL M8-0142]|uniref:hypothetical protein n=1 Tax=Paenibacillus sp. FSL M8-0142 TaxID=2954525 RepID=UPI003159AF42